MTTTKTWTVEEIKNLLKTNKNMVIKSLIQIYNKQTADEQKIKETRHHNNVGFNATDAKIMSSIAQFYIKYNKISEKQYTIVYKKIQKYAGQLTKIANGVI